MRALSAELLVNEALHQRVVHERLLAARESVLVATANVKAMMVEVQGRFVPISDAFLSLTERGVAVRVLHAELPSRPFRAAFDRREKLFRRGGARGARMELKQCPRVHFKAVIVDGGWAYLGSANLTGAGLGAKHAAARNFELGFVTEDFDVIDRVTALFEAVWSGAECSTCRRYDLCPDPIGPGPTRPARKASGIVLGRARRLPRAR